MNGLKNRPWLMNTETKTVMAESRAEMDMAMASDRCNFVALYQVLRFPLPNPRRSMALVITSMRSSVEKMSGVTMSREFLKRSPNFALFDISSPRACCA